MPGLWEKGLTPLCALTLRNAWKRKSATILVDGIRAGPKSLILPIQFPYFDAFILAARKQPFPIAG
jgi:hypothetical protein